MKVEIEVEEWVNALRSNEYKQGRAALKRDDTYCCLGVACDMLAKNNVGGWTYYESYKIGMEESQGTMPSNIQLPAGFTNSMNGEFVANAKIARLTRGRLQNGKTYYLTQLNDTFRMKFKTIAKIIELVHEAANPTNNETQNT